MAALLGTHGPEVVRVFAAPNERFTNQKCNEMKMKLAVSLLEYQKVLILETASWTLLNILKFITYLVTLKFKKNIGANVWYLQMPSDFLTREYNLTPKI